MEKTEKEKLDDFLKSNHSEKEKEDKKIDFIANLLEAINYASLPKRERAQVNRIKYKFYKKYGICLETKHKELKGDLEGSYET